MNERREAYERGYEIGYPAGYWFRMNSGLVHDAGLDLLDATGPLDGSDFAAGHDDGWNVGYRRASEVLTSAAIGVAEAAYASRKAATEEDARPKAARGRKAEAEAAHKPTRTGRAANWEEGS